MQVFCVGDTCGIVHELAARNSAARERRRDDGEDGLRRP